MVGLVGCGVLDDVWMDACSGYLVQSGFGLGFAVGGPRFVGFG